MDEKYMWILDAANGSVFKFVIPHHFPDNGDFEELVMSVLQANEITQDVRIQDCSWQEATSDVQVLNSRANGLYW